MTWIVLSDLFSRSNRFNMIDNSIDRWSYRRQEEFKYSRDWLRYLVVNEPRILIKIWAVEGRVNHVVACHA